MFGNLAKYGQNGYFFFKPIDKLREVCNALTDSKWNLHRLCSEKRKN